MADDKDTTAPGGADETVDAAELDAKCEAAAECAGECECECCECLTDEDDQAVVGLACGVASLVFGMFGFTSMHFLALPLGLVAVSMGKKALDRETRWHKQAWAGIICGVIGASFWAITMGLRGLAALFG